MGKKYFERKQEQNDLGKLLEGANEEKAKGKVMKTNCSTVDDWKHVLEKNLKIPSALLSVIKGDFQDAGKLFEPGKTGQVVAEVTLRQKSTFFQRLNRRKKPEITPDAFVLPQFDPNFNSIDVVCRYPTCKNKNPEAPKPGSGVKRDLYLCPNHREQLKRHICQAMEEEGIDFPKSEFASEPGRFEGYTSLISLLDGASRESKNGATVREVALNTRNFLIITSTLLNPDDENLSVTVPPVAVVTERIFSPEGRAADNPEAAVPASASDVRQRNVTEGERAAAPSVSTTADRVERTFRETIGDRDRVQNLLSLLRGIIDIILFAFGVLYTWVVPSNIGGKIGAGVGMSVGLLGGFVAGPAGVAAGVGLGGVIGGLIGCGVYDHYRETRERERNDRARREWLEAGEAGGNPTEGEGRQSQGVYQCTIPDDPWNHLRMYIALSSAWSASQVLL